MDNGGTNIKIFRNVIWGFSSGGTLLPFLSFLFFSFLLCSALLFSSLIFLYSYIYFIGLHIMGQYNGNAGYPPTAITENVTYAYNTVYGTNLPPSPPLLHPLLYLPYFISLHFISYVSSYFAFITFLFRPVNFLFRLLDWQLNASDEAQPL